MNPSTDTRPLDDLGNFTEAEIFAKHGVAAQLLTLDPRARERVLERFRRGIPAIIDKHIRRVSPTRDSILSPQLLEELARVEAWSRGPVFRLERNEHTRIHQIHDAMLRGDVFDRTGPIGDLEDKMREWFDAPAFVVQHDWGRAFENAKKSGNFPDRVELPFERCLFEFRVSGRVVVFMVGQATDVMIPTTGAKPVLFEFVNEGAHWFAAACDHPAREYLWNQVVAVCMALDSEVATHEIVRGPADLNAKRERNGKMPLKDFHIVKLDGRHVGRAPAMGGTHASPRLHFRRGHWRHYETHTTWIRWTLAGDPDLGFVDKEYRL